METERRYTYERLRTEESGGAGDMGNYLHHNGIRRGNVYRFPIRNKNSFLRYTIMRALLIIQLVVFFTLGSLIVEHKTKEAEAAAVARVLLQLPMKTLGEVKI